MTASKIANRKFPLIEVRGTPRQIGLSHGSLLAERIVKTVEFYRRIFKKEEKELLQQADFFKDKIQSFSADYAAEIEAIGTGSGIDPRWIYILNARSEILSLSANECTTVCFRKAKLLGQNWDWAKELEDLSVIMRIERGDGHRILMITEPGIIGKIGLNSSGIGVCLNLLRINKRLDGVPVHVVLRATLDSRSLREVGEKLERAKSGKASNLLVGDADGNCVDVEFAGDEIFYLQAQEDVFVHTNHYLGQEINKGEIFASSFSRYGRATEIVGSLRGESIDEMKNIFLDRARGDLPICRPYVPEENIGSVGTICSLVMDLGKRQIHMTRGNPIEHEFETFQV